MNKIFFSIISAFFFTAGVAQSNFDANLSGGNAFANDINGRPLYLKTEYVADGSPYLYEDYCLSDITTLSGKVYRNIKAKINLQDRTLLYKLDNGQEMEMTTPIKKIKLYSYVSDGVAYGERTFQGYQKPLNDVTGAIYELVYEDSASSLLKQITVTFNDSKRYNEATITRTFKKSNTYFAAIPPTNTTLAKVEKNKTAVAALFGAKSDAVSKFINDKKLKCKSDEDLAEVFRYYGSL